LDRYRLWFGGTLIHHFGESPTTTTHVVVVTEIGLLTTASLWIYDKIFVRQMLRENK